MYKFGALDSTGNDSAFRYSNTWMREATTGPERIVVAPAENHIDLMIALSRTLPEPFGLLYVLLVPRRDHDPGRYQCPVPLSRVELEAFLTDYRAFFEGDGRHHVWVTSLPGQNTLIYDQHNVIYCYGSLPEFEAVLGQHGIHEGEVRFPVPHSHHYNPAFDDEETRLMAHWEWNRFPLVDGVDER